MRVTGNNNIIMGVDPGKKGGWAMLRPNGSVFRVGLRQDWVAIKPYVRSVGLAGIERQGIWGGDLTGGKVHRIAVLVEDFGWWQGILEAWGVRHRLVAARSWRAHHGLKPQDDVVALARGLWPELENLLKQRHDGIAVALLIAKHVQESNYDAD